MIMINMKRFCIISALFLAMLCGAAQEFLTPTSYGLYGTSNIFEILLTGNSPNKLYHKKTPMEGLYLKTFYISAPSFSPEYALIIEKDRLVLNKAIIGIGFSLYAKERMEESDFKKLGKDIQKPLIKAAKSLDTKPIKSYTLSISKEISDQLTALFEHATKTATYLEPRMLGNDGTMYYFNNWERLVSVWTPFGGRTYRLRRLADSLCFAVEHNDIDVLHRQMKLCKSLNMSFKKDYPLLYFQPDGYYYSTMRDKGPWHCSTTSVDNCIELEIRSDTAVNQDFCKSLLSPYYDSIAVWSREIFLTSERTNYPSVIIDNHADIPECEVKLYHNGYISTTITIPEKLWRRDVILEAAQLSVGRYYIDEELDLHWRDVLYRPNETVEEDTHDEVDTTGDYDGVFVDYFCAPEFPGGLDSLYSFIRQNLQWPNVPGDWNGTVLVEFVVEVDGSITNPRVKVSLYKDFDEEAIRVIKLMPKWIWDPSRCYNGEIKRTYYQVPVRFTR